MEFSKALTVAFRALRKKGLIAHKNFWCCQSCACSAIDSPDLKPTVRGYVFYTRQDNYDVKQYERVYLAYGILNDNEIKGQAYMDAELAIANDIVDALKEVGLDVKWDGSTFTRILTYNKPRMPNPESTSL